ncbi:DDE-type integrase/transposase/recombinase [Paraburkholderia sp. BR10879]
MFGWRQTKPCSELRGKPGRTRHLDEVFVTLRGEPYLLWRAVEPARRRTRHPAAEHRDKAAAKRFFNRLLAACADAPRRIVTDQLRSYPAEGRNSRTGKHQTRLRQSQCPGEQPCRKQPSTYA